MKTKLAVVIFLLAIGGSASAQLVLTICSAQANCPGFPVGSVQAPIDQNGWRNFKVTLTQNVTSFSFVGIPPSPAQAAVNVIFTQDATGGRTVTFAAGITSSCTVTATANSTTLCQFEYDGVAGQWFSISGGGAVTAASMSSALTTSTAATAASAIALGSGSTNANSADGAAGTSPLSMTLNINVGDFVILFTNTQDTSATVADNGTGGGNTYIPLGSVGTNRGKAIMWYVQSATVSASQITVTDAANVYTISGATYVNVLGIGTPIAPANQATNSLSLSVSTIAANSLVVGCYTFNTATTFTPTSGSTVTSSFNGTNTVNTALMSITTTTTGSYSLNATTNQGTPVGQGLAVELRVNTGTNHSPPGLTLTGTGWNGSSSTNQAAVLQNIVPNVSNPLMALTATPAFAVVNNGLFNNSRSDVYLSSSVNGANPAIEYTGVSRPLSALQNSAVFGGISVPAASTQIQSNGVFGAANSFSSTTFAVGGYFSSRGLAPSGQIFGGNTIAMDGGFAQTGLVSLETDITQSSGDAGGVTTVADGVRVLSNGTHRPAAGVYIVGSTGQADNFLAPLFIDDANSGDTNPTRLIYLIPPDNLNTTTAIQLRNHANAADVFQVSDAGAVTPSLYQSLTNCAVNSVSPAACGSAPAGAVVIPTTTTTYTVNTTAVTAASRIFLQPMTWASNLPSAPTCVAPAAGFLGVSASTAATSFTVTLPSTTGTVCLNYWIVN